MSGIYGIVRYDGAPVTPETLGPMAAAMSPWGPDGHGQWCGDGVGLGHMMLHVTPESLHERLPASIRTAPHLVITADARIDNRDELFDALGAPRPGRSQTPDSSLILLAYERWGGECVRRLLGDFAFAIWDSRERRLFCARDHFGCRPFVYHWDGRRFVFASDIKGVLTRIESPQLNKPLLAAYLQFKTYHAEVRQTFFEGIIKLPPAHTLSLGERGVTIEKYWSPLDAPSVTLAKEGEYPEQMRALFQQAVECRLRSAFPVGSHLSGGLDSSSIAILAARTLRERGRQLQVFSWSAPPSPEKPNQFDHLRIESVCSQEGLRCQYVPPTIESVIKTLEADFTVEPRTNMAREANIQAVAAAQSLRIMLSGWGGDEAVTAASSTYLSELAYRKRWSALERAFGLSIRSASSVTNAVKRVGLSGRDLVTPYLPDVLYGLVFVNAKLNHYSPCIHSSFASDQRGAAVSLRGAMWRRFPTVQETMRFRLEFGNVQMRLEHWATSGAKHRLDYRYPMLDKRLVEFSLGMPWIQLSRVGQGRALFRDAAADLLPKNVSWMDVKNEPGAFGILDQTFIRTFTEWLPAKLAHLPKSPVIEYVDTGKIRRSIRSFHPSQPIAHFGGIREAASLLLSHHIAT